METILSQFERSEIVAADAERALDSCVQALEGIGFDMIHAYRNLCYRLTVASYYDESDDIHFSDESEPEVLAEFRDLIARIPNV